MGKTGTNQYLRQVQSQRIKECMHELGISNKILAKELNYTPQHISYIVNGKRTLTVEMAIALADFFNKYAHTSTYPVRMPYDELSEDEKLAFDEDEIKDGFVETYFEDIDRIDYRYLLGEKDFKTYWDNFDNPRESSTDYRFKLGIISLLHFYGYDLKINMCPDVTTFQNLKPDDTFNKLLKEMLMNPKYKNELIKVSTGKTIELLPCELYQLFQDFMNSITRIVERRFDEQQWYDNLNAGYCSYQEKKDSETCDTIKN